MKPISVKTKLPSLFVLTFLCLNAGGAVCLVYCQGTIAHVVSKDNCPIPMDMADCPHAKTKAPVSNHYQASASSNTVSCCTLAINILAAPLERKPVIQDAALCVNAERVLAALDPPSVPNRSFVSDRFEPPRLDRRFERLKHCVFRI